MQAGNHREYAGVATARGTREGRVRERCFRPHTATIRGSIIGQGNLIFTHQVNNMSVNEPIISKSLV